MSRGPLAAVLLLAALSARAQPPRTDWLCVRAGEPKQQMLVSLYWSAEGGASRQCALFAENEPQAGMTSFRSCARGKSAKPLFSASPVCAYEVDIKAARVTKRCDWSEPPAPPAPVYDCKPVEEKE